MMTMANGLGFGFGRPSDKRRFA